MIDSSEELLSLGIDLENLNIQSLALCNGVETELFYDKYEQDEQVALITDQMCLSCPIMYECLQMGMDNNDWGTWGAVYLVNGKPDDNRNSHKTEEVWEKIRERISE